MVFLVSQAEMNFIQQGCHDDCRGDGRTCIQFRPTTVLVARGRSSPPVHGNLLIRSNGSARLLLDQTQLLCSVKADIIRPSMNHPDRGVVDLSVEHHAHASSSSSSQARRSSSRADEETLQQLLEDLLLPHLIDTRSLCLLQGTYVWRLCMDLLVLTSAGSPSAGSLLDASAAVIRTALQHTWLPNVKVMMIPQQSQNNNNYNNNTLNNTDTSSMKLGSLGLSSSNMADLCVEGDMSNAVRVLPVNNNSDNNDDTTHTLLPRIVTVTLIPKPSSEKKGDSPLITTITSPPKLVSILDATAEEVACSAAQIHVCVRDGVPHPHPLADVSSNNNQPTPLYMICALQTSGSASIPLSLFPEVSQLALRAAAQQSACCHVVDMDMMMMMGATAPETHSSTRRQRQTNNHNNNNNHQPMLLDEIITLQ